MDSLISLDHAAFQFLHDNISNSFLDIVMPIATNIFQFWISWVLLLGLLTVWIWKKRKQALIVLLGLGLSVVLSETISYRIVKNYVSRPRPELTPEVKVSLKTHSHSGKSFPSLHASNNFAGATFLASVYPGLAPYLFFIASVVAFSRIYVGVHFPLDVIAGALIGIFCGYLISRIFRKLKMP